ncbi:hypothetical protein [Sporosarcina jiandibaonis]|uniref:hypothetical protein n=1 Tax=Sporosarcina jiandibaonis TaxID=2715535 RepID=UPI001FEBB84E|nr:hypothetical protein [Sporosarcina jiandibaonis]
MRNKPMLYKTYNDDTFMKDRKFIYIALVPFIISMVLNFPFPHKNPYGETVVTALNIPIRTVNGFHYVGLASLLLLIASLSLLGKSLRKYHVRFQFLAIMIAIFIPPFIASTYQKTVATGIYAISYQSDESNCNFEMKNETTLHGVCELLFENYNKGNTQFTVEFYEHYPGEDDLPMLSLMNNDALYVVTLKGKERKRIVIKKDIDVSQMKNHIEWGQASDITIIIKSGEKTRKL